MKTILTEIIAWNSISIVFKRKINVVEFLLRQSMFSWFWIFLLVLESFSPQIVFHTPSINTSQVREILQIFLVTHSGSKSGGLPLMPFDLLTLLMKILCERLSEHNPTKLVDLIIPMRSSLAQTFHKTISCRHEIGDRSPGKAKQASMKKHKANRCGDKKQQ